MPKPILTRRHAIWLVPGTVLVAGVAASTWIVTRPAEETSGIGGPFTLVDGDGRTVTDKNFAGKWMLLYFGYTHCPDACPTALQDMANAVDMLDPAQRNKVALVFVTVDPQRDTPAVVKEYVSNFDAPITALSGSAEQVAQAARAYRVYYAKQKGDADYTVDHSSIIYVMNPRGQFVTNFTHQTAPAAIADKLKTLI